MEVLGVEGSMDRRGMGLDCGGISLAYQGFWGRIN